MKYVITESQYNKLLVNEYGWYPGYDKDRQSAENWYKQNAHTVNTVLQIGSAFIPVIGPFISAGIGLADAKKYYDEGDTKTAGLIGMSVPPIMTAQVATQVYEQWLSKL